ncbi:hypothetical protein J2S40_000669 [Nocardioides luteus]|uniref:Peptidase MA-like domain-containing protein n=1 Tax=Nocardioides luteus TaxID=1844 RepID=A0ABQ5T686_9ACTN|nr:hypothetical protein [Nocardioides luteus]MDR7309611.1 hypothetical protein [Nocardioides luteus]GGR52325.1 hypothetical protein GCM10010197_18330 [Nocardioides luteus]GLJ70606.1 hypothetical protein GCM10017579_46420 [Nocardioides luteus]
MRIPGRSPIRLGPLLAVMLLSAGCAELPELPTAAPTHPPYEATPADYQAVRDLLDRRATAALQGDETGFLATVDPRVEKLLDQQRTIFDNLQQLPMTSLSYRVKDVQNDPDEVRNDGVLFAPKVVEVAQMEQAHRTPVSHPTDMTFVRHQDRWVVGRDRAAPVTRYSRPWFGGPVSVAVGRSVAVVIEKDGPTGADDLLERVKKARTVIKADLKAVQDAEKGKVPLLVDATNNGKPPGDTFDDEHGAAAVTYRVDAVGPGKTIWKPFATIVVKDNPVASNRLAIDDRTLRHELSHVYGPILVPTWVKEGLAEHLSRCEANICDEDEDREELLAHERALPDDDEWGEEGAIDYAISHAAVSWLIEEHGGLAKFIEFCNDFFSHRPQGSTDYNDGTDEALRASYGITEKELVAGAWDWFERLPSG